QAQGLAEDEGSKPRAVDEQISRKSAAVLHYERIDETIFGAKCNLGDLALDALHAPLLGVIAQELSIEVRVEMISVGVSGEDWRRAFARLIELAGSCRLNG